MKKIFDFVEENCFGIFVSIGLFAFLILVIICEYQLSKKDLYDLEKSCYEYYRDNNYILDECVKYEEKFK